MDDLVAPNAVPVYAAIVGKAFYERTLDIADMTARFKMEGEQP